MCISFFILEKRVTTIYNGNERAKKLHVTGPVNFNIIFDRRGMGVDTVMKFLK